jgi:hypothetical protein
MKTWHGASPSNVRRDGKYSIVLEDGEYVIQLRYRLSDREVALLTTVDHDELVDMVNHVKEAKTGRKGGAFYINEYKDVLVPTADSDGEVWWAGTYDRMLKFELEPGVVISPKAPRALKPGDPWPGPRVGTKYTLTASGDDLRYSFQKGRITTEVRLSDHVGEKRASALAKRIAKFKLSGGGVYVNECCEMFIPTNNSVTPDYIYVGCIDEDAWFRPPDGYDRP